MHIISIVLFSHFVYYSNSIMLSYFASEECLRVLVLFALSARHIIAVLHHM